MPPVCENRSRRIHEVAGTNPPKVVPNPPTFCRGMPRLIQCRLRAETGHNVAPGFYDCVREHSIFSRFHRALVAITHTFCVKIENHTIFPLTFGELSGNFPDTSEPRIFVRVSSFYVDSDLVIVGIRFRLYIAFGLVESEGRGIIEIAPLRGGYHNVDFFSGGSETYITELL